MTHFLAQLDELWASYGSGFLAGLGVAGLAALVAFLAWVKLAKKRLRPGVIWLATNAALLLNAEGMYEVLTQKVHLPGAFVWLVFFVFEVMLLVAESVAAERYRATTTRGEDGRIVTPGDPGPMIRVVWAVALISGLIVATNAETMTEKILRIALPVLVVWIWWAVLTAEGRSKRRGRFAFSPVRIAEARGWIVADGDEDLAQLAHARKVRRMVRLVDRIETSGWFAGWATKRLRVEARTASDEVQADVVAQVERSRAIVARFVATGQSGQDARAEDRGHSSADAGSMPGAERSGQAGTLSAHTPGDELAERSATMPGEDPLPIFQEPIVREIQERAEAEAERAERPGPKSDEEVLRLFRDQLVEERGKKGELTVYRVRKVCRVGERQGKRLHALILAAYAAGDATADPEALEALRAAVDEAGGEAGDELR